MENSDLDFTIERLGECRFSFPQQGGRFTDDGERILYDTQVDVIRRMFREGKEPPSMEVAGPREKIFFDPSSLACGIVTCGGLCPGLNDVIRAVVLSLSHHYGVTYHHSLDPTLVQETLLSKLTRQVLGVNGVLAVPAKL